VINQYFILKVVKRRLVMMDFENQFNDDTYGGAGYEKGSDHVSKDTRRETPCGETYTMSKGKKLGRGYLAVALACSILGGSIGAGVVLLVQNRSLQGDNAVIDSLERQEHVLFLEGVREKAAIDTIPVDTDKVLTAPQVYANNVNSTVGITTSITTNFWGFQSTSAASGSGFIISEDGYILTNHHVIESSSRITVSLYDGKSFEARVIGYDESNDIAVLKIDAHGLSPVIFGDSSSMNVGDDVIAIGNPLGELTFSLTAGKISAKDREVAFSNSVTMNLMQTDCAINSGNSGGALFNMYGEVIGVTNAKYSSSSTGASIDNIGFAIPINSVRPIIDSIIEKGYVAKPFVGVTVSDVAKEYQIYGLPDGASVQSVSPDSPAAEAGIQIGDIITGVNGTEISGGNEFVKIVNASKVGEEMLLTIYRRGNSVEIKVKIAEKIQSVPQQQAQVDFDVFPRR
jgi:serine protease Do